MVLSFIGVRQAAAQTERILHSFGASATDGQRPFSGLAIDGAGNLYGTTFDGGAYGYGMVFEFSPAVGGGWVKHVLHSFNNNGVDGVNPLGLGGLVLDPSGNIYGTTLNGGANGYGAVFEVVPRAGGGWSERILYSFAAVPDAQFPFAGLARDPAGNLYGTTLEGGASGIGTVFQLRFSAGAWFERVLHSFSFGPGDGNAPAAELVLDSHGNLYGTTPGGGASSDGVVFELKPQAGGVWVESLIHNFVSDGVDGYDAGRGLVFDSAGNLYGTTLSGGTFGGGVAFELARGTGGSWTESILQDFGSGTNGSTPNSTMILDAAGNLYGTTSGGGTNFQGVAFKLTPALGGIWDASVLHNFGSAFDGQGPLGVVSDGGGNLYGTTQYGGTNDLGTVFEIAP